MRLLGDIAEAPLIPAAFIDRYARSLAYSPWRAKNSQQPKKLLTDTQYAVMLALSQGKTFDEMKHEGISYDPRQQAFSAKTRLGALTNAQAVGIAVRHGIVPPPNPVFPPGQDFQASSYWMQNSREKLTDLQRRILVRVSNGMTNQEIADEFGTGLETVKTQLAFLFRKYSARDRAHLAALAVRMGHIH